MDRSDVSVTDTQTEVLDIGKLLGRREAFGLIAGRCSAAEAACLRQIRDGKQFRSIAATWEDFCTQHLHMGRASADRAIRLLQEFGPDYFELSQLIRIAPEAYRAISSAVKEKTLYLDGEAIALIPENAGKIAAAIAQLRQHMPDEPDPLPFPERLSPLRKSCREAIHGLHQLWDTESSETHRALLKAAVNELSLALASLNLQLK